MAERNPYAISFGRIPTQYINRSLLIDNIIETLESDVVEEQAFKLTGIRGTGKTVTLTAIERQMRENKDWIVVGLKSNADITEAMGEIKRIMEEVRKKKKRVLVTIDEARKTEAMIDFIQEFQILIREDFPIYVIAAGLYEDIESLSNADGLTFFLRAAKYEMTPLNLTFICNDYEKTIGVSHEVAEEMAKLTKGYPFAYQALGKYMWDTKAKSINDEVLALVDEALSEKVYNKIWQELAQRDKWFMQFIVQKEQMPASELLEITKKKHNEWSEPRKRLSEKGIIDVKTRGMISLKLPRFKEFVERQMEGE